MTTLDDRFLPLAERLLAKYGKAVTVTQYTAAGGYDPATSAVPAPTEVVTQTKGFIEQARKYFNPDLIEKTDLAVLIAGQSLLTAPVPGDHLTFAAPVGDKIVIQDEPVYSGESIALHVLLVR